HGERNQVHTEPGECRRFRARGRIGAFETLPNGIHFGLSLRERNRRLEASDDAAPVVIALALQARPGPERGQLLPKRDLRIWKLKSRRQPATAGRRLRAYSRLPIASRRIVASRGCGL